MAARHCIRCRALFNYLHGEPICPKCKEKEEEEFKVVRKFLRQYPKSTINQTVEETGVSVKLVTKFIREGRLEITDDSPIGLDCKRCGKMIKSGYYCDTCSNELKKEINQAANKTKDYVDDSKMSIKKQAKMHYFNHD